MFFVVPQGQLGHFAPGQFPPQVSANETTKMRTKQKRIFIKFLDLNLLQRFITLS
jgi:hypothetical protein